MPLEQVGLRDISAVGGKNASLGELMGQLAASGVRVPEGFATTAHAYHEFLAQGGLAQRIEQRLAVLDIRDLEQLAATGQEIRGWIQAQPLPQSLEQALRAAWIEMESRHPGLAVAVRSSATAEDLPDASFAGQQETFLNVRGADSVLQAVRQVFASLFTDRAIAYRVHQGFGLLQGTLALSAGIQRMVRSDLGASGVLFTLDTESGFQDVVFITSAYGLGECVVQGAVNPDEFYVDKRALRAGRPAILRRRLGEKAIKMVYSTDPKAFTQTVEVAASDRSRFSLNDADIEQLARLGLAIESHYGHPMDIEWGKDGIDGALYILQARPETVKGRAPRQVLQRYRLGARGPVLATGRSIGQRIGSGTARIIATTADMVVLHAGEVLVTDMTDPDWEPIMRRASAIVTNRGGRTCHAAIIARELGIPAVVGCGNATQTIPEGAPVTVSCAEGEEGRIYDGLLPFEVQETRLEALPSLPFKIMMNVGNPERAFDLQWLPNAGVGLARMEFIVTHSIGIHPRALLEHPELPEPLGAQILARTAAYASPTEFYVRKLAEGIATLGAAFWPKPVIVRLSDFKSNEYGRLLGGERYEPAEENPMLGLRGASRYLSDAFRESFSLECRALRYVREDMGFTNIEIMVPFVRTVAEARDVIALLADQGLVRGVAGLRVIMMCELPSNALLAADFLEHFDGFSIGSNDMTQLTLGLDRDSGLIAHLFDERDPAVKALLHLAITAAHAQGKYIGLCGQGPSDHPDFARWLMQEGIDSVSLNPDSVIDTWLYLSQDT